VGGAHGVGDGTDVGGGGQQICVAEGSVWCGGGRSCLAAVVSGARDILTSS
jgi:hypothetical protein